MFFTLRQEGLLNKRKWFFDGRVFPNGGLWWKWKVSFISNHSFKQLMIWCFHHLTVNVVNPISPRAVIFSVHLRILVLFTHLHHFCGPKFTEFLQYSAKTKTGGLKMIKNCGCLHCPNRHWQTLIEHVHSGENKPRPMLKGQNQDQTKSNKHVFFLLICAVWIGLESVFGHVNVHWSETKDLA